MVPPFDTKNSQTWLKKKRRMSQNQFQSRLTDVFIRIFARVSLFDAKKIKMAKKNNGKCHETIFKAGKHTFSTVFWHRYFRSIQNIIKSSKKKRRMPLNRFQSRSTHVYASILATVPLIDAKIIHSS